MYEENGFVKTLAEKWLCFGTGRQEAFFAL